MQSKRLSGKRILITRAAEQQADTIKAVRAYGAMPVSFPCLALRCLPEPIRSAANSSDPYSDVLFTSANGVHCVAETLRPDGLAELLEGRRLAAVGRKTETALKQYGLAADLLPAEASQEGLLAAYRDAGLPHHLLFFRAEDGRELLGDELIRQGCRITLIPAYRTVCPDDDAAAVRRMLAQHAIDAVLLGSPRTASHYVQRIADPALADRPVIAAISRQVATAAETAGLHVQVVAEDASFEAMLSALADYFSHEGE
jgi:uroporphyrinogen-III synthase